jgi:lysophospholipase L1-like esterase
LDWNFSNVSTGTHQLISRSTPGFSNSTSTARTFEFRVTNWGYGVQLSAVHLAAGNKLIRIPDFARKIAIIGDSLSVGQYNTYEGLSSWGWSLANGLGNTEFTIQGAAGICLVDTECWGNKRGQIFQWFHTQDTTWRARQLYGVTPEKWDFAARQPADLVMINLGTNDQNNVTAKQFRDTYDSFVGKIHDIWPKANIILMSLTNAHWQNQTSWVQNSFYKNDILAVHEKYKSKGFVHYFDTKGIMQHNDIVCEHLTISVEVYIGKS